jgi:HD-like signal output (HDOD) protein
MTSKEPAQSAVSAKASPRNPSVVQPNLDAVIRRLSIEVAAGDVRLPSLPDIAIRVQKVLDDPRAPRSQIVKVVAADAALAARIMKLANSAFLNPSSAEITDLQRALTQLGQQLVRCSAVSFSLQQMKLGSGGEELRPHIRELWRKGALVAAIAYVLAKETGAAKPDVALMCGLMHNIGELYVLISEPHRAAEFASNQATRALLNEWHPRIASAILKHWKFPVDINMAVGQQNVPDDKRTPDGLADVLTSAKALEECVLNRDLLSDAVTAGKSFEHLKLTAADCKRLLGEAAEQIKGLRAALSGS